MSLAFNKFSEYVFMIKNYRTISPLCQELKVGRFTYKIEPMVTKENDKQAFSDRLNAVLDAAGVVKIGDGRQGILKKIFKVSDKGARKWIQGESIPRYERLLEIVERYKKTGVTVEWLLSGNPELSPFRNKISENKNAYMNKNLEMQAWKVPVINWVKAGEFTECIDNYLSDEDQEWIGITTKPQAHTFALQVKGDSMEPLFVEGMLIIIEPGLEAIPGDYIIAMNGKEATFKQFIKDGADYYLKPLNDRYPIKPLGDSQIIGVVREAVIKFR